VRHVSRDDAGLEAGEAEHRGGADRAAVRHQEYDRQVGEGEHDAEHQADGHDRQDHRQDDLVVAPPEAGAVDGRRVDHVLRHRGDAGEEDDDGEGEEAPGIDDDDRQHRQVRIAEPVRRVRAVDEAGRDQRPVDHAVKRVEHPLPGDGGERDRHRPRQDDQRAHELAARERTQEQQRAELAEDETEELRAEGEDEGVVERVAEARVFEDVDEIRQSDEFPGRIVDRVGADRVIHRHQERHADQQQHVEDGGGDEERAENVAPVQYEPDARDRLRN